MPFQFREGGNDDDPMLRRIRHLTSIQVRNFTPFPVRDAFTSALSQPSGKPQFNPDGRLSDDLDATFGRKRGRRLSSASVNALRTAHADADNQSQESPRRASHSTRGASITSAVNSPRKRSSMTAPATRSFQRTRRISTNSSSGFSDISTHTTLVTPNPSHSGFLSDASQIALEHILDSRLVETCLTVSIPSPHNDLSNSDKRPVSSSGTARIVSHQSSFSLNQASSPSVEHSRHVDTSNVRLLRGRRTGTSASSSRPTTPPGSGSKRTSTSPSRPPLAGHTKSPSVPIASSTPGARRRANFPTSPLLPETPKPPPTYRFATHRPSTNPCFNIDARSELKAFGDLSGEALHVEVLGNIPAGPLTTGGEANYLRNNTSVDKKGKMRELDLSEGGVMQWKVLERWDVNLRDLIPLPKELAAHPSLLPSNSLLITLSPPGQTFYLPSRLSHIDSLRPPSRPPSPSAGYNSDPETSVRRSKSDEELRQSAPRSVVEPQQASDGEPRVSRYPEKSSTTFNDLLRLVTQQTIVLETRESLTDVIRSVDLLYTLNPTTIAAREVSERKATVRQLEAEKANVEDEAQNLRNEIDARREALKRRRQLLEQVHRLHQEDLQEVADREDDITEFAEHLELLRNRFAPTRSILLGSLASIFPIELLSPPDLLFTIIDVPLPIPVPPTDPAPPSTLPGFNCVTEDAVATALGYAAQLVHITAAYLNVGLTYPITCVGSRSLIKDGISAMVGPRMFPLYSKGVDTYRFEYAVFLLNKDIELLMAGRDLRALDMRHTLPNLKNLLLTLTDPETPPIPLHPPSLVLSDTDSVLQSPATSSTSLALDASTPNEAGNAPVEELPGNIESASATGSATPTKTSHAAASTPKKSRAFFGLAPLSGFLRARYPSTSKPDDSAEHTEDNVQAVLAEGTNPNGNSLQDGEQSPSSGDEEDDRKTIRPTPDEDVPNEDKDSITGTISNGSPHANGLTPPAAHVEKPVGSGVEVNAAEATSFAPEAQAVS